MRRLSKQQRAELLAQGLKHCYGCSRTLELCAFSVDRSNRDGLQTRCRQCISAKIKQYVACPECGGLRSVFSANRCKNCHKRRSVERKPFTEFRWPRFVACEAYSLLRDWHISWADAEGKLTKLIEVSVSRLAGDESGLNWYKHVSLDAPLTVEASSGTRHDLMPQQTYNLPDAFIDEDALRTAMNNSTTMIATRLGVRRSRVQRLIRKYAMRPVVKIGKDRVFAEEDVLRLQEHVNKHPSLY